MISEELPFRYRNQRGEWTEWTAMVYRPEGDGPFPLIIYPGYEATPEMAAGFAAAGVVMVTPKMLMDEAWYPNPNPIGRGLKLDEALVRAACALPYVDDAKVAITGGSAAGYMTMMMSAATFPLVGSFPMVPPVNLNYGRAVWSHNSDGIRALRDDGVTNVMKHPGSDGISGLWIALIAWHDTPGKMWRWSPLAHLDKISCPVVLHATSADALVPIGHFGGPEDFLRKAYAGAPTVHPIDPDVVGADEFGHRTLVDMLPPDEFELHMLDVPEDTPLLLDLENPPPSLKLSVPLRQKRWMVILLDEGGPTPDVGHFKHSVVVDVIPLLLQCMETGVTPDQLTKAKLELLADRWLGRDWIETGGPRDLTDEELADERADVRRGLATFAALSPDHAERLAKVTAELDPERAEAIAAAL